MTTRPGRMVRPARGRRSRSQVMGRKVDLGSYPLTTTIRNAGGSSEANTETSSTQCNVSSRQNRQVGNVVVVVVVVVV